MEQIELGGVLNNPDKEFSLTDSMMKSNTISFNIAGETILELEGNGNIYVKGQLVENNKQVVEGLYEFIQGMQKLDSEKFLDNLFKHAKKYGWKGDYTEIRSFVRWCYLENYMLEPTDKDLTPDEELENN